jgi:AraC-like DNA-binding protein
VIFDPENLVPLCAGYRFLELAACHERMEDLGMLVGRNTSAFELGAFGKSLRDAETVHDYLRMGSELIGGLSCGGTRFWLSNEDELIRVNQSLAGPVGLGRRIADVYTLVVTLNTLRQLIDPEWSPGEIRLMAGTAELLGDRQFFGDAVIIVDQRHSSFTMTRTEMRSPVSSGIYRSTASASALHGAVTPMPTDFRSSVEQLILSLADDGFPDIGTAARAAGLSPRTLQRRLLRTGTSYTDVVKDARTGLARNWLATSDLPIADISAMLGYLDPSNFTRAFRRETGMSPTAWRAGSSPAGRSAAG